MPLSPEEQAELKYLESLAPAPSANLTDEEQAELEYLESLAPAPTSGPSLEDKVLQHKADRRGVTPEVAHAQFEQEQREREGQLQRFLDDAWGEGPIDTFMINLKEAADRSNNSIHTNFSEGVDRVKRGFSEDSHPLDVPLGVGQIGLSGLEQAFQPIDIPVDTVVGIPAGQVASDLGATPDTAEKVRFNTGLAADVLGLGGWGKRIRKVWDEANPALRNADGTVAKSFGIENLQSHSKTKDAFAGNSALVEGVPQVPRTDAPFAVPSSLVDEGDDLIDMATKASATRKVVSKETADGLGSPVDVTINAEGVRNLNEGVEAAVKGDYDESKRLFLNVTEQIKAGEFDPKLLPKWLKKYNLTNEEAAILLRDSVSNAGRQLQEMSALSKRLKLAFKDDKDALKILQQFDDQLKFSDTWSAKSYRLFSNAAQAWRVALIVQPATAIRNITTQAGRIVTQSLDEALRPIFKGGSYVETTNEMRNGINHFSSAYSRMTPSGRKAFDNLLDSAHGVEAEAKMLGQPVHELTAKSGGILDKANFINRAQEFFTRRVAFESYMRKYARSQGKKLQDLNPDDVPQSVYDRAVEHSMEMSMAANPKNKGVSDFVKAWGKNPMTTFIMPFPRFVVGNLLPFMKDHSPLGFLSAFSDEAMTAMAKGDPEMFAKHSSRALIGTLMLGGAIDHRASPQAGERWDTFEKADGTKRESVKALAPFANYYLMGEAFHRPHKVKARDWVQAFVGINKAQNTTLAIDQILTQRDGETAAETGAKVVGEILAGYTTWFRAAKDVESVFNPDATLARDTRAGKGNLAFALAAPTINNMPFLHQFLPRSYSVLREEALRFEAPSEFFGIQLSPEFSTLMRQFTGRSEQTPTELEKVAMKYDIDPAAYRFRTGLPDVDRQLSQYAAPLAKEAYKNLQESGWLDTMPKHLEKQGYDQETVDTVMAKIISGAMSDIDSAVMMKMTDGGFDGSNTLGLKDAKKAAMEILKVQNPMMYERLRFKKGISNESTGLVDQVFGTDIGKFVTRGEETMLGTNVTRSEGNDVPVSNDVDDLLDVYEENANKGFVDRIINKENYPTLDNGDGSISTHSMSWGEADGKYYAYPTVILEKDGTLKRYNAQDAWDRTQNTGNFIEFKTAEKADWFTKNYKKIWSN